MPHDPYDTKVVPNLKAETRTYNLHTSPFIIFLKRESGGAKKWAMVHTEVSPYTKD